MAKDSIKYSASDQKQLSENIQFLLSNIRARQNGLIFFLERFHMSRLSEPAIDEYKIYKNEFLQKQKIHSTQIKSLIQKYTLSPVPCMLNVVRSFWIKLKSIVKVSLERLKSMDLLDESLFQKYEQIIEIINRNYDDEKGLKEYVQIEYLIKKRTIDIIMNGKNQLSVFSQSKINKNRSETLFKQDRQTNQSLSPFQMRYEVDQREEHSENARDIPVKIKSLSRSKNDRKIHSEKLKKNKLTDKEFRKFQNNNQKYERLLCGVMDGKLDCNLDKKKSIFENVYNMYDSLFAKNISNHKAIAKFVFASTKMSRMLLQIQQLTKKRKQQSKKGDFQFLRHSSKIVKKGKHQVSDTLPCHKMEADKRKQTRPKTSKQNKTVKLSSINRGDKGHHKEIFKQIREIH